MAAVRRSRQLPAVAFVRRPFSLQLEVEVESTSTAISSPRSSNSNTRLCIRPLTTLPHHGLFRPGYRCSGRFLKNAAFYFPQPLSVSQLKVTGFKLVDSSTLPENFPAKKTITDGGSIATHSKAIREALL